MKHVQFADTGDRFTLSFRHKLILDHSRRQPCLEVSRGSGRFRFIYGLFKIRGRTDRKQACRGYAVTENDESGILVMFEGGVKMRIREVDGRLHIGFETQGDWNRLTLRWVADPAEKVYGGGEQYSRLNLRGRRLPVWVQEPGLGRGRDLLTFLQEIRNGYGGSWYTTYFSQPTFVFTSGFFVHSESPAYTEGLFDGRDRHGLHVWEIPEKIVFDVRSNPAELMGSLTSYLGRQPRIPDWTWDGMWLGAQGGREETRRKLRVVRDAGVKVGGLWSQDWEGIRITSFGKQLMWDWSYDSGLYPDLPEYSEELKGEGIRFLGYINSFLAPEGDLYKEASEKGYCVKNDRGEDYMVTITTFPAAMLDLTNPECRSWIKKVIIRNMIGAGLSGWMADFGEYIPTDAVFHDGSDGLTYHNRYAAEWARVNREAVEEAGREDDVVFFMRAGYTGSTASASMFWNGDQLVNWSRHQGFPTVIPGTLSMGFTGAGYVHSDLGGYTTVYWLKRSRELLQRWAEQAAFTQTMRSHEGNRPQVGTQLFEDPEVLSHLAKFSSVFAALKPYHRALSEEYQETGVPPVRHPWIHYPAGEALHEARHQYQYMYGPDLFVAPVVKKGADIRDLHLPEDDWIHLWSGTAYPGGRHRVAAPVGEPAVFYRSGSDWRELFKGLKSC